MGIATIWLAGFLDDLCGFPPLRTRFYSLSYCRCAGRGMRVHLESTPPEPETLRGLDAIGTSPPFDSRRRPKGAHRVHGLDELLYYCTLTIYLFYEVFPCIIGTPSCSQTTKGFTGRDKQKIKDLNHLSHAKQESLRTQGFLHLSGVLVNSTSCCVIGQRTA